MCGFIGQDCRVNQNRATIKDITQCVVPVVNRCGMSNIVERSGNNCTTFSDACAKIMIVMGHTVAAAEIQRIRAFWTMRSTNLLTYLLTFLPSSAAKRLLSRKAARGSGSAVGLGVKSRLQKIGVCISCQQNRYTVITVKRTDYRRFAAFCYLILNVSDVCSTKRQTPLAHHC